jgi:hypothetical protein
MVGFCFIWVPWSWASCFYWCGTTARWQYVKASWRWMDHASKDGGVCTISFLQLYQEFSLSGRTQGHGMSSVNSSCGSMSISVSVCWQYISLCVQMTKFVTTFLWCSVVLSLYHAVGKILYNITVNMLTSWSKVQILTLILAIWTFSGFSFV